MIEDDIYRTSSQFRLWSYTEASLRSVRANTNALASQRVRAALRRARPAHPSAASSAASTPNPADEDKEIECLTPDEEQDLIRYYCEKTLDLGDLYEPILPTAVRATAIQYLRRFYLTNSPMTYHPKSIMPCALFLATKTDNYYMSLRQFADALQSTSAEDVITPEFLLMQGLRFTFDVRHPFRGLEGGIMELQSMAQGQGQPAPHFPHQTPENLKQGLFSIAPNPNGKISSNISDRIARAHHNTRELLKTAAQMTDVYFLYTPSQIWLSALLLADPPLAQYYLDTKVGPGSTTTITTTSTQKNDDPFFNLRSKLLRTLDACSTLLKAYKPVSTNPEQMKNLKRIAKKLYHCQNPEKVNLAAGRKRDSGNVPSAGGGGGTPGTAAGVVSAASTGGGVVGEGDIGLPSESEVERMAKKRKLEREKREREARDVFGGELVTQRTKGRG